MERIEAEMLENISDSDPQSPSLLLSAPNLLQPHQLFTRMTWGRNVRLDSLGWLSCINSSFMSLPFVQFMRRVFLGEGMRASTALVLPYESAMEANLPTVHPFSFWSVIKPPGLEGLPPTWKFEQPLSPTADEE